MSTRQDHLKRFVPIWTKGALRRTPFELGANAYTLVGSLKGLPYGPGKRQDAYILGFRTAQRAAMHRAIGVFADAPEAVAA